MAEPVVMPKLAMGHTEGQVIEWLVRDGDWVDRGQPVMVVETEKVAYECEAPDSGFFHHGLELDVTVPVGTTVAWLAATDEELAEFQAEQPAVAPAVPEAEAPPVSAVPAPAAVTVPSVTEGLVAATAGPARTRSGKIKISPVAKKYARQHALDATRLVGTGPGGRIVKRDVDQALSAREAASLARVEVPPAQMIAGKRVRASLPLKGMRKAIADHMVHSLTVAAQLSHMGEIDMTEMIRLRKTLLQKEEEIGLRITYTDLFVLVLAKAVQYVPLANSSLVGDEIKIWEDINIGIAVALEIDEYQSGLIVPVVKDAGNKSLVEISRTVRDLTSRAREGKLTPVDVDGGTITLSNVGQFAPGWSVSTPIINQPESVIVQPGGIFDKPLAVDGQVVIRPIMTLSITFDHRVLDGVPISKFYIKIKELIENPAFLHL